MRREQDTVVAGAPRSRGQSTRVWVLQEAIQLLAQHRELAWSLAKRELTDRHVGSVLGPFWTIGHPLFLMAVYVFVFAVVLQTRIGDSVTFPFDYSVYILSGLIPWMAFQESMNKSCASIAANPSLVKQVVFPIEVLPVKGVIASFLTQLIASGFLIVYVLVSHGRLPWTYSLLPALFFLQLLAMTGVGYALAAVSVYIRDTKDVVQVFGLAGVYVMPIFYLPQWVPPRLQPLLYLNPFSYMGWCYQDALYFGRIEHVWAWPAFFLLSVLSFYGGYRLFRRLKASFGDFL